MGTVSAGGIINILVFIGIIYVIYILFIKPGMEKTAENKRRREEMGQAYVNSANAPPANSQPVRGRTLRIRNDVGSGFSIQAA